MTQILNHQNLLVSITLKFDLNSANTYFIDDIEFISQIFLYLGIIVWIFTYIFFGFSSVVSEKIGFNFRYKYLEAVLQKDTKWFDESNSQELPTKISSDCQSIQRATGEKFIMMINAFMSSAAGFLVAFLLGWIYAFCLLVIIPLLF